MRRTPWSLVFGFLLACHAHPIRPTRVNKAAVPERLARPDPQKKFTELAAGAQLQRGFFDVYQKEGQVYLAIAKNQLDKQFLLSAHIERGKGSLELFAGRQLGVKICEFRRRGDTVYVLTRSSFFSTAAGSSWEQSVDQSYAPTVLDSAKVEATRADGAVLIAVQGWLTSDLTHLGALVQQDQETGRPGRPPDVRRSFVESVHVFPDNVNFSALLTFASTDDAYHSFLQDDRYLPVGVSYSLSQLPKVPMTPRLHDDRIGVKEVLRHEPGKPVDPVVRYVQRWRLQPGQPLTFYLDPSIPAAYRPFVIAGVEAWDRAFAAAGWQHMISARPLPVGASPGDLRYPSLRWVAMIESGFRGVTTTVPDPRTGEILGSTIVLDGDSLVDARLLRLMLILQGRLRPEQPLPTEFVGQMIKMTTMHEVGHALGLPHNFAATLATSVDMLANPEWVKAHGVASSVMDYPAVNLPPSLKVPLGPDFPLFNQDIGPTDIWAIRYLYERDDKVARELARTAAQNGHRYAEHSYKSDAEDPDPTVATHDLGSDPFEWARRRLQLLRELLAALPGPLPGEGGRASDVTQMVRSVLGEYGRDAQFAVRYIGGYQNFFDHAGDPLQRPTAVVIPKARQREALAFLAEAVFREDALQLSTQLRSQMGVDPFTRSAGDPVLGALTMVPQVILKALTAPNVMNRLKVAEVRFGAENTVTTAELFDALDTMIFGAAGPPPGLLRREVQREYIDRLGAFVLEPLRDLPKDVRALAREHLMLLRQRLTAARGGDVTTTAHRHDLVARISQMLDAHLVNRGL